MATMLAAQEFSVSWMDRIRRRRLLILALLVLGLSLGMARAILAVNIAAAAVLLVLGVVTAIAIQPRIGLYVLVSVILFFDGIDGDPLMLPGRYIMFSLQTTVNLSGAVLIPFEMLLLLTAAVWLAHGAMRRRLNVRLGALGKPVALFGFMLAFGIVRGLVSGANFNYSLWESRFLVALVLTYVVTVNLIQTRAHYRTLLTLIFIFAGMSGVEGIFRRYVVVTSGALGAAQEQWFAHEDVVIWGLVVFLALAQRIFGGPRWMRILGPFLGICAIIAMLVSQRRAGLIAVMIAFAIFTFILFRAHRKAFWLIAIPALIAAMVYLPLFWNNGGTLGQPARAVRSLSSPDPRDAASNMWRDLEAINVRATIASDPLLGIGFGRPFLQIVAVPDISFFEFWNYESHHNILWVWMKVGAIGFTTFFVIMLTGIARAIWLARSTDVPELRVFAVLTVTAIVMSLVFCYVDLGLTGHRLTVLLGLCLGAVGVMDRLREPSLRVEPVAEKTFAARAAA